MALLNNLYFYVIAILYVKLFVISYLAACLLVESVYLICFGAVLLHICSLKSSTFGVNFIMSVSPCKNTMIQRQKIDMIFTFIKLTIAIYVQQASKSK